MAAELIQVRMTKSVDFASRGELIWMEPAMARSIVGMGLAVVTQEQEAASGGSGEGDGEPPAGNSPGGEGQRPHRKARR